MKIIRSFSAFIARFLISLVFLVNGMGKVLHWHDTEKFLMGIFSDWQTYVGFSDDLQWFFSKLTPLTPFLLGITTAIEFLGGLSILLGVKEKIGAALLILFLLPSTILIHQFWYIEGVTREMMLIQFLKNLAILGCLILILLHGTHEPKKSFPLKF